MIAGWFLCCLYISPGSPRRSIRPTDAGERRQTFGHLEGSAVAIENGILIVITTVLIYDNENQILKTKL